MNKQAYVIFTGTIAGMGGAQKYVANKAEYLSSLGYEVFVFSGVSGQISIPELDAYKDTVIEELNCYPLYMKKQAVDTVVNIVLDVISASVCRYSVIMVESNTPHISLWAEIVSDRLKAKHFVLLLDEVSDVDPGFIPFFKFKFSRRELAFINAGAIGLFFGEDFTESFLCADGIDAGCTSVSLDDYVLSAACSNVSEDVHDERFDSIDYDKADYVLCSLGRLNKGYIHNVIEGFGRTALNHPDEKLLLIFIGDQPEDSSPDMMSVIKDAFSDIVNVELIMTGFVYPVPSSFYEKVDLAVASAGSARVLWSFGVPTISMDANDGMAIGVLGYTTENTMFRKTEPVQTAEELIEKVLFTEYLDSFEYTPCVLEDNRTVFAEHLSFIRRSAVESEYYPVLDLKPVNIKNIVKKVLIKSLGSCRYRKLMKILRNQYSKGWFSED